MKFKDEILNLYNLAVNFKENKDNSLPENVFFLNNELILCKHRKYGDSRYPYSVDGLTLWAHSSGNISLNESNYFIFPPTLEGKQSSLSFFGGIKKEDGTYDFISINGNSDTPSTHKIEKYTIYSRTSCYYLRVYQDVLFALKGFVGKNKKIYFSLFAFNLSNEQKDIYLCSYMNPLLLRATNDNEEAKWFKTCEIKPYGAHAVMIEDISRTKHIHSHLIIKRIINKDCSIASTTSREIFAGGKHNNIILSDALVNGYFEKEKNITVFNDTGVFGEIIKTSIKDDYLNINYQLSQAFNDEEYQKEENDIYNHDIYNSIYDELINDKSLERINNLDINFEKFNSFNVNNNLFNSFLKQVINQVDYCAKAKNSSLSLLGIRDAFQMIESSLIWDPVTAREKILQSLSFIDIDGRSPRQYSIPKEKETHPIMDNREYIDQGQWVISTLYQYLAFTNDFSILEERCKYFHIEGNSGYFYEDKEGTVKEHLEKIIKYLIKYIDKDTSCLCTLYGDWNDAVNGLGLSKDEDKEYGNGVSVMATLHLIKNLYEIKSIFNYVNYNVGIDFDSIIKNVKEGVNKYAVVKKGSEYKVVHGWGEDRSFYVGSFEDVDGISRDSLTSNAFYVISGLLKERPEMKKHILKAYERLDSKYGYLTFNHYFDRKDGYKVGRIINLPKGTAENAATYIHATLFGIRSLILMNETQLAFDQLYKVIPITHSKLTHSPFVMPNSYIHNEDIDVDGESMNDWYTGSSNTIIKAIVFDLFGINPLIGDEIEFNPSSFPCEKASISINIKNKKFLVKYVNKNLKTRTTLINGKPFDKLIYINDCLEENVVEIID